MAQKYPGLIAKNSSFYFRLGIPRKLWEIARCKEICYSLNTLDYHLALTRWKTELTHLQTFLEVFEEIIMKINSDNKLILDETDVDKVLLYRLGQIQHFLEENVQDIEQGHKTIRDIQLFNPKDKLSNPDKVQKLMARVIIDYLKGLVDSSQANMTLRTTYSKLKSKEIELGLTGSDETGQDWFKSFGTHINSLEKYASHAVKAIRKDSFYKPTNPKVVSMLQTYDSVKTIERINAPMTRTHWTKFFKKFATYKMNIKGSTAERMDDNKLAIKLCFLLMGREYLEEITKQDCRRLCEKIYRVPKRWSKMLKGNKIIDSILTDAPTKIVHKHTIRGYLLTFKEYMRYAVKEDLIPNSLNDFIDIPLKIVYNKREPFTNEELKTIFNPETYPTPKARKNIAKFWVPLICLHQGTRLNEICQLNVDDIIMKERIPCISINEEGDNKSVKNKSSVRIVPIHPKLIEMGFLHYVEYQRQEKQTKLFSHLTKTKRNGFGKVVQSWFARYLDTLGITDSSKVFHSFRHTFETKAIDCKIPQELQNALGGWFDYGIGQRVYGKKKTMHLLLSELSKIKYPIQKELKGLSELFRSSYICQ